MKKQPGFSLFLLASTFMLFLTVAPALSAGVEVTDATYDAAVSQLKITFSEMVQIDKITSYGISLTTDAGKPYVSLVETGMLETSNSSTITFQLHLAVTRRKIFEIGDAAAPLRMNILTNSVFNLADEGNRKLTNLPVNYLPDSAPLQIDSVKYAANLNRLQIYCDRQPQHTFRFEDVTTNIVDCSGLTLYDAASDQRVTLSGFKSIARSSNNLLKISAVFEDLRAIESLENTANLQLLATAYAISGSRMEGNREVTVSHNLHVTYLPAESVQCPVVTSAIYDAVENQLRLDFENITTRTRGIDSTLVSPDGIKIDDDQGGPNPDVSLSGGTVHGIKSGRPSFVRTIVIDVTETDEVKIKRLVNKNSLHLVLEPGTFFLRKTLAGNLRLPTGLTPIAFQTNTAQPEVIALRYDFEKNHCSIEFSHIVNVNTFLPTGFTISGVKLTGGTVAETGHSSQMTLTLNATDKQALAALSLADKSNLTIQLDAGSFQSIDGISNLAASFQDGAQTEAGHPIVVGYRRSFWVQSFEAFPVALHQQITASLRGVGEHCYIYVADNQWNTPSPENEVIVNQAAVNSILSAFETRCPANPNQGIYTACQEVFGDRKSVV